MASDDFNLDKLHGLFCKSKQDDSLISLEGYVNAFEELSKLFNMLGSVFTFVTSDVVEKIGILRDYLKDTDGKEYTTVQSMIRFEVENNLTKQKHKASGCRTLLRLHRAMEFTALLMLELKTADEHEKLSAITRDSYDKTLSKFHPWLIRKGVHVAVHTLPSRKQFLEKLKLKEAETARQLLGKVSEIQTVIFEIIQEAYKKDDLLDLP